MTLDAIGIVAKIDELTKGALPSMVLESIEREIKKLESNAHAAGVAEGRNKAVDGILTTLPEPTEIAPNLGPIRKLVEAARNKDPLTK